jgi:3-deoxy-D-manno-octulosonic-acid transferase
MPPEERRDRLLEISLSEAHFIWVAGSTHPGEETLILGAFKKLLAAYPHLRLILAPRQVDRGNDVAHEAGGMGLRAVLRTKMVRPAGDYHVLVLNTMGELGRFYGLGAIGFVGGSLVPFGGHNLLEPAAFGCPVLFGPHTHNFVEMSESLTASGGGRRVADADELSAAMELLLANDALRAEMGARARRFVQDNRGAVTRIVRYLESAAGRRS